MKIAVLVVAISFLGVFWFVVKQNQEMISETHLIPKGFTGVVMIIHNQSDGVKQTDDKNPIYHIPKNGVLLTQMPLKAEIKQIKYYYHNGTERKPLEYVWDFDSKERVNNDTVYVYGGSTGTYGHNGKEVDCTTYIVGILSDLDSLSATLNDNKPIKLIQKR